MDTKLDIESSLCRKFIINGIHSKKAAYRSNPNLFHNEGQLNIVLLKGTIFLKIGTS